MGILAVTRSATASNPNMGDIELSPTGSFFLREDLAEQVDQRLRVRFRFFKGEWFLNLDAGMPYFQFILVKGQSEQVLRSIFTQAIQGVGGVEEVLEVTPVVDRRYRTLTVTFRAKLSDGSIYASANYAPFVITAGPR